MSKYSDLKIPRELIDLVKRFIEENPEYGYTSVPEFVKEAVRLRLEELSLMKKSKDEQP